MDFYRDERNDTNDAENEENETPKRKRFCRSSFSICASLFFTKHAHNNDKAACTQSIGNERGTLLHTSYLLSSETTSGFGKRRTRSNTAVEHERTGLAIPFFSFQGSQVWLRRATVRTPMAKGAPHTMQTTRVSRFERQICQCNFEQQTVFDGCRRRPFKLKCTRRQVPGHFDRASSRPQSSLLLVMMPPPRCHNRTIYRPSAWNTIAFSFTVRPNILQ